VKLLFEHKIATLDSYLFAGFMQRVGVAALPATPAGRTITVNDAHAKLGHCSKALARKAAQYYDWKLMRGGMPPCEECATGKGRQKDVVKDSDHIPSEVMGERFYIDIASIKRENSEDTGYSKMFWLLAVDEYSHMKFLWFLSRKSELSGVLRDFVKKCKGHNINIK